MDLATEDVSDGDFDSPSSLLDWDIVLFRPSIDGWISHREQYRGKPSLNDHASFKIKEASEHWRREIRQAVESGKTVVIFLAPLTEVYIDTGNREYSGTGRNRSTTRIVDLFSNYKCVPMDLRPVNSNGTAVKLAPKGADLIAPYWSEFEEFSEYRVLVQNPDYKPLLQTRNGDITVGTFVRGTASIGSLICLPDIDFYRDGFLDSDDTDDEPGWKPEARQFAARLVASIVALDAALRADGEITPSPNWSNDLSFSLSAESTLRSKLLEVEAQLEAVQKLKESVQQDLSEAGRLRTLLFEKGKPLERAIISALKILGFNAEGFQQGTSEFDVVFESPEGRLIGEAEGKDTKAINVDKLRQLAMNLHEDLQRDEVVSPAKGVLFGNAHRLTNPNERPTPAFTEKCILAAKANGTALVSTVELFFAAQYLSSSQDSEYALECRRFLLDQVGVVSLPKPTEDFSSPPMTAEK